MTKRWLWTQKQDIGPSPRSGHAMAYDAARQRVVLFGGETRVGRQNDTWEWDGRAWTEVADTGPSARSFHDIVYDDARQRLVLFGGNDADGVCGDTWEWDGEDWTQVADIGLDPPRGGFAMAYDKGRRQVVLFGGLAAPGIHLNDTWAWDGTDWTQIADTGATPRRGSAMVFDSSRKCLVLFGGTDDLSPIVFNVFNDTWEWGEDDKGWVKVQDIGPHDFGRPQMVYTGKHTVLYTSAEPGRGQGQTWEWDGRVWTQRQNMGPKAREDPALAYDSQRDRVVLFGGLDHQGEVPHILDDTWELAIVEQPPA